MAISVILRVRIGDDVLRRYEAVIDEMNVRNSPPPGEIYHFAASTSDGMIVAQTWETREAFDKFAREKLAPVTRKQGFGPPEIEFGESAETIDGGISSNHGAAILAQFAGDTGGLLRSYDPPPPGLIFRSSARRPGGVRTVEHWRGRDEFEDFLNGPLAQAMRSAGIPEPHIEVLDVYDVIDGREKGPR